ncbi:MAG TPA: redoxin domain-containing protein [Capsulimonadaceae bacterium]|jgi:thiol-disulfide isomerase/thioredoxin
MFRKVVVVVLTLLVTASCPTQADPTIDGIVKAYVNAAKAIKTLRADVEISYPQPEYKDMAYGGRLVLVGPGMARQDLWVSYDASRSGWGDMNHPHEVVVANGQTMLTVSPSGEHNRQLQSAKRIQDANVYDFNGILSKDPVADLHLGAHPKYLGVRDWLGTPYKVVESDTIPWDGANKLQLYFGPNHLIRRVIWLQDSEVAAIAAYRNVVINSPVPKQQFALKLPRFAATPGAAPDADAPKIDAKARAILTASSAKFDKIRALTGRIHDVTSIRLAKSKSSTSSPYMDGEFVLAKPNLAYVHTWRNGKKSASKMPERLREGFFYADGTTAWSYWDIEKKYYSKHTGANNELGAGSAVAIAGAFYGESRSLAGIANSPGGGTIKYAGERRWNGTLYKVVSAKTKDTHFNLEVETYFGSDDLPHRIVMSMTMPGRGSYALDRQFTNLQTPATVSRKLFSFTPPEGATEKDQYARDEKPLLANGTVAPEFAVKDAAGKVVKLSDFAGRVVVIDFWSTWCGPCQQSMPVTNAVAQKYAAKPVTVLAINVWDNQKAFVAWLPKHKKLSAMTFLIDPTEGDDSVASKLYNVSGIPTQYVIDPAGKIAWSGVGFDPSPKKLEKAIDAALAVPVPEQKPATEVAPAPTATP